MLTVPIDRRMLLAVTCVLALEACAAAVPRDGATPDVVVALVSVPAPTKFSLVIDKHPDAFGSQARALFYGSDIATGERSLDEALTRDTAGAAAGSTPLVTLSTTLTGTLLDALRRPGVAPTIAPESHRDRIELVSNYAALDARADRFLDVVPRTVGYWSVYGVGVYRPWIRLEYRVYDARANKIVSSGLIGTGPAVADGLWIPVPQDDAFAFRSFDALLADPVRAMEGLRATIAQVARALGQRQ